MSVTEPEPSPDDAATLENTLIVPIPAEAPVMAPQEHMDANQRCDSCGGQAYVKTQHQWSELLWCAHHFHKYELQLHEHVVLDERHRLNVKLTSSY